MAEVGNAYRRRNLLCFLPSALNTNTCPTGSIVPWTFFFALATTPIAPVAVSTRNNAIDNHDRHRRTAPSISPARDGCKFVFEMVNGKCRRARVFSPQHLHISPGKILPPLHPPLGNPISLYNVNVNCQININPGKMISVPQFRKIFAALVGADRGRDDG